MPFEVIYWLEKLNSINRFTVRVGNKSFHFADVLATHGLSCQSTKALKQITSFLLNVSLKYSTIIFWVSYLDFCKPIKSVEHSQLT